MSKSKFIGKFTVLNVYIRKEKGSVINYLSFLFIKLKKNNFKVGRKLENELKWKTENLFKNQQNQKLVH
jgi:hypothetical protein